MPRRQLGRHLRELRQESGLTIAEVARLIERGAGTVQRLETGTPHRIRLLDIEALCRVLHADQTLTDAMMGLARQGNDPSWWHEYGDLIPEGFDVYIGLEAAAASSTSYGIIVPGLLQTPSYAEVMIRTVYPDNESSDISRRVQMRLHRQKLVTRTWRPMHATVLLDEHALHRVVGSPAIMSQQLRHLADLSTRENIEVRVVPFNAASPLGDVIGPYFILDFAPDAKGTSEPPVVHLESFTGSLYLEQSESVERYRMAHRALTRVALNPQQTRDLLRQAARRYVR
ncbi:helix-turn-helix domain-containing protein [Nocardia asteroides]|uniref:helix-turn-helix domain-containing protein n=1 Tax=Nocardia asteroides TaxID=1824 RepID=UPI001E4F4A73|nr:helix-turn-helix transcriptional regulator [Nocardia asteroides]UGT64245.1 helix-turn-helix domain-containing protein [Nocardia asteroides]